MSNAFIRNRALATDDYSALSDDAPLPESGKAIVSLARWTAEADALRASGLSIGVRIPNTADLAVVWPQLADRPAIELEFPAFGDGRAYSQARLLRQRYGYAGEIRARGAAVVRDQLFAMARCGINAFVLREDQKPELCLQAFAEFREAYQAGADDVATVNILRREARAIAH